MRSKRTSQTAGFTIIEVLIVLAIAGLILLIVLEAIPTLTRNSRNNQRKQDVQTILEAVSRWELNNSGGMPSNPQLRNFLNLYGKLSYYTPASSNVSIVTPIATNSINITNNPTGQGNDKVVVYNHNKCNTDLANPGSATNAGAGYNDVVALYSVETSSGLAHQCQQL